jgi:penicillin-binding protein 1A
MRADDKKGVAIYAAKTVRGQIIAKSLAVCGIPASFDSDPTAAIAKIEKGEAALLVVDVNNHLRDEIDLVRSFAVHLADCLLITHTDPRDLATLEALGIDGANCISGPLDPERIYVAVDAFFAIADHAKPIDRQSCGKQWRMSARGRRARQNARNVFRRAMTAPKGRLRRWWRKATRWSQMLRPVRRLLSATVILSAGAAAGYLFWCLSTLPDIDRLNHFSPFKASKLYSSDNQLLAELYEQRRTPVPLSDVPPHVRQAFIAVEDARYFQHSGIDPVRIAGALWADIKAGGYHQGGSTITQQLSKMIFLNPEKTITRKIKEMAIALMLERTYSKDRILELYLNQAYFGSQAYGIQAAAEAYFGKDVNQLNVAEGALLAALPKAPNAYSPFRNPERSRQRRDHVLQRMEINGFIPRDTCQRAVQEALPRVFHGRQYQSPYFIDYCQKRLEETYGDRLATTGLKVYTTLDARLQAAAEAAISRGMADLKARGVADVQAALVALALDTGQIKAMVGGTDYDRTQFNRATQALRQPGSAFKPLVYMAALKKGFRPDSLIQDLPVAIPVNNGRQTWRPRNYTGRFDGEVTVKEALTRSLNAATVNLALQVGLKDIIETARMAGIQSKLHAVYPTVLGASEVTLIELVAAYGTLATGRQVVPVSVDRIIDKAAASIWDPGEMPSTILPSASVAAIREMLAAVVTDGTARRAQCLDRPVYGKTGTTNANADALFIGFDDDLVVGVWVGRDNREPIGPKETGARAALPIWIDFMQHAPAGGVRMASLQRVAQ